MSKTAHPTWSADHNRGPNKYPHWHDGKAWARRCQLKRAEFLRMSAEEFADWVETDRTRARTFFYAHGWPEAVNYSYNRNWLVKTCYPGLYKHRDNWPTILLDTDE